jgi:transcription elongation factor GreB
VSKAFTSDSDDEEILERAPLPEGVRNYMTVAGADRLRQEIQRLMEERRALSKDMEGQAREQKIERQLRYWLPRLEAAVIIDPLQQPQDLVLFGATVTLTEAGSTETWRIVGLDEADFDHGWISWLSPLATALLEKRMGSRFEFRGRHFIVTRITYQK